MRYSIYNNLISLSDKTKCIYNAASDKFVLLNSTLSKHLEISADALQSTCPTLFEELYRANVIVEDGIDEYRAQLQKSLSIKNNKEQFRLIVNPTLDCNLHCWYCYENHIKGSKITETTMISILKFIDNVFEKQPLKSFSLYFFGGEPLLEFESVKIIIEHVIKCCQCHRVGLHVVFTTNGVLVDHKTIDYLAQINADVGFQITLDGDRKHHNITRFLSGNIGTYDTILNNVKLLLSNQIDVLLRINYTADNFLSFPSILEDLNALNDVEKAHLKFDLQKVWQEKDKDFNETEVMEMIRQRGFRVSTPNVNVDNLRFPCYADYVNQLLLNYNGDVFKCTARDFNKSERLGHLNKKGDVDWDVISLKNWLHQYPPKKICETCSIFPLCGGGCVQKRSEIQDDVCIFDVNDRKINRIILDRFY